MADASLPTAPREAERAAGADLVGGKGLGPRGYDRSRWREIGLARGTWLGDAEVPCGLIVRRLVDGTWRVC